MVKQVKRKSMTIRESGRSTDFISPSFGYGCLYDCSYCYMKRHLAEGLTIASNPEDILTAINNHAAWLGPKVPNQTDPDYWTYDISCNEDFALHAKYHQWKYIFDYFKNHDNIKGSFATKYVQEDFLHYDPNNKIRIRFSLMPANIAAILEPNTSLIIERIKAIDCFQDAGYEVHINFSPIVVTSTWLSDYANLFHSINDYVTDKENVYAECIFLTHNKAKHVNNPKPGEDLIWTPSNQETKISQYGGENVRYNHRIKRKYIRQFIDLHNKIIPWNKIRYIF